MRCARGARRTPASPRPRRRKGRAPSSVNSQECPHGRSTGPSNMEPQILHSSASSKPASCSTSGAAPMVRCHCQGLPTASVRARMATKRSCGGCSLRPPRQMRARRAWNVTSLLSGVRRARGLRAVLRAADWRQIDVGAAGTKAAWPENRAVDVNVASLHLGTGQRLEVDVCCVAPAWRAGRRERCCSGARLRSPRLHSTSGAQPDLCSQDSAERQLSSPPALPPRRAMLRGRSHA
jgi:hypothetical protein